MSQIQKRLLAQLQEGETIDLRGDGKAGCGLVMILQTFAEAVSHKEIYQVQEWPLFSSARKGANVRGFLRIGRGPIHTTCQIQNPHIALLLTEKTGEELDFASGMTEGIFIINTERSPEEIAKKFKLKGLVLTVPGDQLGRKYLGAPLPNISVMAALHHVLPLIETKEMLAAIQKTGKKRRLPDKAIQNNLDCFTASIHESRSAEMAGDPGWEHPLPPFEGYGHYPTSAQSRLRSSLSNKTANYARAGRRLIFEDPND
ncbi:MAG: 2-oxoacid:acceptor oxidoreductase family protein, partial [bacterium]|nr:2-oxoacid:acceptor oxidoreductase family protein [bacterium]